MGVAEKGVQCSAPKFYLISIKIISDFSKIAAFSFYLFLHYLNPEVSGYLSCLWLTTQRYTVNFYYFAVVIFFKITKNFESATSKPLFLVENIVLGSCKLLFTVFSLTYESPLDCKVIQPVHPKGDQSWIFIGRTDAEAEIPITLAISCKQLTHWKRPWFWEGLGAGGEGDDRGWDGWMASPTRWTWVWVNSGSWWWTGRPGMLWFMGSQRVGHDWATELKWTDPYLPVFVFKKPIGSLTLVLQLSAL